MKTSYTILFALSLFSLSCSKKPKDNELLSIKINSPQNKISLIEDSVLTIFTSTVDPNNKITKVDFIYDGKFIGNDHYSPFEYVSSTTTIDSGNHSVEVIAYDENNKDIARNKIEFNCYEVRSKYIGNYSFTVHLTSYGGVWPKVDTTMYYDGKVKKFETIDYQNYYFRSHKLSGYTNRFITIEFLEKRNIIAFLKEDGVIDENFGGTHDYQKGKFNSNNIEFTLGSGGLGGGFSYEVSGVMK